MIQGNLLSRVESRSHSRIRALCEMDIRNLFFASPAKVLIGVLIVLVAFFSGGSWYYTPETSSVDVMNTIGSTFAYAAQFTGPVACFWASSTFRDDRIHHRAERIISTGCPIWQYGISKIASFLTLLFLTSLLLSTCIGISLHIIHNNAQIAAILLAAVTVYIPTSLFAFLFGLVAGGASKSQAVAFRLYLLLWMISTLWPFGIFGGLRTPEALASIDVTGHALKALIFELPKRITNPNFYYSHGTESLAESFVAHDKLLFEFSFLNLLVITSAIVVLALVLRFASNENWFAAESSIDLDPRGASCKFTAFLKMRLGEMTVWNYYAPAAISLLPVLLTPYLPDIHSSSIGCLVSVIPPILASEAISFFSADVSYHALERNLSAPHFNNICMRRLLFTGMILLLEAAAIALIWSSLGSLDFLPSLLFCFSSTALCSALLFYSFALTQKNAMAYTVMFLFWGMLHSPLFINCVKNSGLATFVLTAPTYGLTPLLLNESIPISWILVVFLALLGIKRLSSGSRK